MSNGQQLLPGSAPEGVDPGTYCELDDPEGTTVLLIRPDAGVGLRVYKDWSAYNWTLSETGSNVISDVSPNLGATNILFNGGAISPPDNAALEPGASNWTFSWWSNVSTVADGVFSKGNSAGFKALVISLETGGTGSLYRKVRVRASTSGTSYELDEKFPAGDVHAYTTSVWTHFEVCRRGDIVEVFVDGVSQGTAALTGTLINTADAWQFGRAVGGLIAQGRYEEARFKIGTALHASDFTRPTKLYCPSAIPGVPPGKATPITGLRSTAVAGVLGGGATINNPSLFGLRAGVRPGVVRDPSARLSGNRMSAIFGRFANAAYPKDIAYRNLLTVPFLPTSLVVNYSLAGATPVYCDFRLRFYNNGKTLAATIKDSEVWNDLPWNDAWDVSPPTNQQVLASWLIPADSSIDVFQVVTIRGGNYVIAGPVSGSLQPLGGLEGVRTTVYFTEIAIRLLYVTVGYVYDFTAFGNFQTLSDVAVRTPAYTQLAGRLGGYNVNIKVRFIA